MSHAEEVLKEELNIRFGLYLSLRVRNSELEARVAELEARAAPPPAPAPEPKAA